MLYETPKMESMEWKTEDVICSSYHEWNENEDYTNTEGKFD